MFLKILTAIGIWFGLSILIYGALFILAKKRLSEKEYNMGPLVFCSLVSAVCIGIAVYIVFI